MADRSTKVKADILDTPLEVAIVDGAAAGGYKLLLEEASATVTYVGLAEIGSSTSSAVWQIRRITDSTILSIEWAGGDALFDKVWDNRAALSYS